MSGEHATAAGCKSTVSYRWQVVRLTNDWFQLRRYPTILLAQGDGDQTDAQGNRTTLRRMAEAEANRPGSTRQVSSHRSDADVQHSTGPQQSRERVIVHGMLSLSVGKRVHFADRDDVYELNDWHADDYRNARRGPWIHYAANRQRFKRNAEFNILSRYCVT